MPLLLAIYPPLFLYARNLEERSSDALFWPLVLSFTLGVFVWLAAKLAVREATRAPIVAFLILFFSFTYGRLWTLLRSSLFKKAGPEAALPLVI